MRRLAIQEFIERAKKVQKKKYDYSKVEYVNNHTPVTIVCSIHGEFKQRPTEHLRGWGCSECSGKGPKQKTLQKINDKMTREFFLKKWENLPFKEKVQPMNLPEIFNPYYDLLVFRCEEHGNFQNKGWNILTSKNGCPKCARNRKLSKEEFLRRAKKIHKNRYDYSKVVFPINSYIKIPIICKKHGVFEQIYPNHLEGNGCPRCKQSFMETLVSNYLISHNLKFKPEKSFKSLKSEKGNSLRFDFYVPKYQLLIECQGKQHFERGNWKGVEESQTDFELRQKYDKIKKEWCRKNGYLLEYILPETHVNTFLDNLFEKLEKERQEKALEWQKNYSKR